jgi:ABC-type uncharacterized transport system YnjBCD ATPase subunit
MALETSSFHEWSLADGRRWLEFHRELSGDYLLRFPGLADFRLDGAGDTAEAWSCPPTSRAAVEHLFISQIVPLALSTQKGLVLHAGAVRLEDGCIAFVGPSGAGKSTLVASLAKAGAAFLTDDGLRLVAEGDVTMASPGHASIRLWHDSRDVLLGEDSPVADPIELTTKLRVLAGGEIRHCAEPLPLKRLYLLGEGKCDRVLIEPARAARAALALVQHSFLLEVGRREFLASHFEEISRLAESGIIYHLDYPRTYEALRSVRASLLSHLSTVTP